MIRVGLNLKNRRFWLSVAVVLMVITKAYGQQIKGSSVFVHYSIEDGLPSSEIYDILQDKQGYIWIATDKGVSRFDGTEFVTYTTRDGLSDNTILRMAEDHRGRLWFIGYNRTLCYLYNDSIYSFRYNDNILEATKKYFVNIASRFMIDEDENITLITTVGRVVTIDSSGNTEVYNHNVEYLSQLKTWNRHERDIIKQALPEITDSILSIPGGQLYSKTRGAIRLFENDSAFSLATPNGVLYGNSGCRSCTRVLEGEWITGFCSDDEGGMWFTTLTSGIFYMPNPEIQTYNLINTGDRNNYVSFTFQDSTLLGFITGQEVYAYQPISEDFIRYNEKITYFRIPEKMRVEEGLKFEFRLDLDILPKDERDILSPNTRMGIYASQEINDSTLLVSLSSSLFLVARINGNHIHSYYSKKTYPKVFKILKSPTGNVWMGSIRGLYRYEENGDSLYPVNHENPLFSSRIQDMVVTRDGLLVLGTRGRGIFIWNEKTDSIRHITAENGLLSNSINQLLYDARQDIVWAATSAGVNCVLRNAKGDYYTRNVLDRSDGLGSLDIRQIAFYKDYLFAGSGSMIIKVPKNDLNKHKHIPAFFLKDVEVNGNVHRLREHYKLPHNANDLGIGFQGISFNSRGVDGGWLETRETRVNYGSMPPGNYEFLVKAVNTQGIESHAKSITIQIVPPFWQTWWFRTLMIALGAATVFIIVRSIINRYKYQANIERRLNELRSLSLRARMNPHFIFNSLNSVQNYILKNQKEEANKFLIVFSRLIRLVLQNSDALEVVLEKELEMIGLYIDLEKKRLRKDFIYQEDIDPDIEIDNCLIPSLLIQPFIENAIWHGNIHTREGGEIKLSIQLQGKEQLQVEIKDNGVGRKKSEKKRAKDHASYATSITRKRINLLAEGDVSSAIQIEDAYPREQFVGTRVLFVIPYKVIR
ncbi:MAG: two-component regulator propeller domain-containing protein [Owenweeksia sp.]